MTTEQFPERAYRDLHAIQSNWGWMVFFGYLTHVLAVSSAISYASITSVVTVKILGLFLIFSGVFHLFAGIFERGTKSLLFTIFFALINLFAGVYVIMDPAGAAITLTLIFAIFFILSGIIRIGAAIVYRREVNWGLVLFSGVVSLILGILIYAQWPVSGLYIIGLFVGIEVFFRRLDDVDAWPCRSQRDALIRVRDKKKARVYTCAFLFFSHR